tara:strand:- start:216 stop:749 length:534 start_codon:yes stop_codon:yes gene_type:complete
MSGEIHIINVKPKMCSKNTNKEKIECPLCNEFFENLEPTCKKKLPGHNICFACNKILSKEYYDKNGGCLYCADPRSKTKDNNEQQEQNTQSSRNINVHEENHWRSFFRSIRDTILCLLYPLFATITFYLINYIKHEIIDDHQHDYEYSLENVLYGTIIILIVSIIVLVLRLFVDGGR